MPRILGSPLVAVAVVTLLAAARPLAEPPPEPAVLTGSTLAPLVERMRPSVVNISTITVEPPTRRRAPQQQPQQRSKSADPFDDLFERFFGARPGQAPDVPEGLRGASLGSGFLVDAQGSILTNNHVVKDATEIHVRLSDGREFEARVLGRDGITDVALLQLVNPPRDLPPAASLGDSDALRTGDFVVAMGSPFGLRDTVTMGIVSAKHRGGINASYDDYIQTDAAINPGNSGGPLFNLRGEVVGINTLIVSPQMGQGIGFAIPISIARAMLPQLRQNGRVVRGFLGVTANDLTPDVAEHYGLPPGTKGAFVQSVLPRSPADKAGLRAYDIIVQLDGRAVDSSGALTRAVALVGPGQETALTVIRGGEKRPLSAKLGVRPEDELALAAEQAQKKAPRQEKEPPPTPGLGLTVSRITPQLRSQLSLDAEQGLVVTRVVPDGPADRANLRRGDVILELNQKPVRRVEDVTAMLDRTKENQVVLLRIQRGGAASILPLRVGAKAAKAEEGTGRGP